MEHWVKNHFYDFKLSYNEETTKEEEVSFFSEDLSSFHLPF